MYYIPLSLFLGPLFIALFEASQKSEENDTQGAQQVAPPDLAVQKDYVEEETENDLQVVKYGNSTSLFYWYGFADAFLC